MIFYLGEEGKVDIDVVVDVVNDVLLFLMLLM